MALQTQLIWRPALSNILCLKSKQKEPKFWFISYLHPIVSGILKDWGGPGPLPGTHWESASQEDSDSQPPALQEHWCRARKWGGAGAQGASVARVFSPVGLKVHQLMLFSFPRKQPLPQGMACFLSLGLHSPSQEKELPSTSYSFINWLFSKSFGSIKKNLFKDIFKRKHLVISTEPNQNILI